MAMNRLFAGLVLLVPWTAAAGGSAPSAVAPDHRVFSSLLGKYAFPAGVDFRAWSENHEDRGALRGYIATLERFQPSRLPRADALAYWLNLYNAATLSLVLDHYPVKSIKDIGGPLSTPWKQELVTIEGKRLTLNQIEDEVIRPSFLEPRIHFALNCAARSCPPLRAEAYDPAKLEAQLEDQTVRFLGDATLNFLDEKETLHLSRIFEWYEADFREAKGSVSAFVTPYIPALRVRTASDTALPIVHVEYDWALNEAPRGR